MAENVNITVADDWFSGEDKILKFTVKTADLSTPQDITGWSLQWELRLSKYSAGTKLLKKTGGLGIALTAPVTGLNEVTILRVDTEALPPGTYYHILARTNSGLYTVLLEGTALLQKGTVGT